jgi:hypothetical protein
MIGRNRAFEKQEPFIVHRFVVLCCTSEPDGTPVFRPAWANDAGLKTGVPSENVKR